MNFNQIIEFNSPTIVCLFSGGIDSTATLYLLLTDPKYKDFHIHVHHVRIVNVENRALAEIKAVNNIVEFLQKNNYRDFSFGESSIYVPVFNKRFMFDVNINKFIGGFIASTSEYIKHVAYGRTKTDEDNPSGVDRTVGNKIFEALTETTTKATMIYPVIELEKEKLANILPKELLKLTWSCRRPIWNGQTPAPCNQCRTCKKINELGL